MNASFHVIPRPLMAILAFALFPMLGSAQWTLPSSGCTIRYDYSVSGNRTDRYWYCWNGLQGPGSSDKMLDSLDLSLYPNPASEQLTIALSSALDMGAYNVYDAQGRTMLTGSMSGTQKKLDITLLAPGLYNFCLKRGDEMLVKNFLVE